MYVCVCLQGQAAENGVNGISEGMNGHSSEGEASDGGGLYKVCFVATAAIAVLIVKYRTHHQRYTKCLFWTSPTLH